MNRTIPRRRSVRGFSLIEVLVAFAITVTVATIAFSFFRRSIDMVERGDAVLSEVNQIETVWQVLAVDLNHLVNRVTPGAAAGATTISSLLGGDAARDSVQIYDGEYLLRLTRDGWSNPLQQQRSDLQRVAYRWVDGQLWRDYWAEKNQPLDEEPIGQRLLLTGLEEIKVRFLPRGSRSVISEDWIDSWPAGSGANTQGIRTAKPVAMEITLATTELGEIQRIFSFNN